MLRRLTLFLICLSLSAALPAGAKARAKKPAASSASALESAKSDWQALKRDAKRSRYRSNWLKVAGAFAQVAKRHPRSPEAPKSLYDAAELYEDLSRISWIQDDVDAAATLYHRLAVRYPSNTLADDARLALAHIYLDRKNDPQRARTELEDLLQRYPKGDMRSQARALLAGLPKEERAPAPSKAVAHRAAKPEPRAKPAPKPVAVASAEPIETEVPRPSAHVRPPPIVDSATVDGSVGEAGRELPHDEDAPAAGAVARAVAADQRAARGGKGKKADKRELAALASAVEAAPDLPLSAQMGLKVKRVVIDAGHGGHDSGAVGPSGIKEKDVSLAVAQKLAEKLEAQGLEVFLTRTDDTFVTLENRAAFANQERADLFISVHCNAASTRSLRGVETYSLNVSSNRYAMRLAARENAASEKSINDLQYILADLATRANTGDSRRLASLVQHGVVEGLREKYDPIRDLGTKEALFYVLLGTRMPAILVETSFISNPTDEKRLATPAYQERLADSIASGVERFVSNRQALAGLDTAGLP